MQLNPDYIAGWLRIIACCGPLRRPDEAASAVRRVLAINPGFSAGHHCASYPTFMPAMLEAYQTELSRAGLPP